MTPKINQFKIVSAPPLPKLFDPQMESLGTSSTLLSWQKEIVYVNQISSGHLILTVCPRLLHWGRGEYTERKREWKGKPALSLHWLLWKLDKIVNWWKWNIVSSHVWPLANPQTLFLLRRGASKNVKWQTSSKYLIHVRRPDWNLEAGNRHSFSTLLAGSIVAVWQQIRKWDWILLFVWQNTRKWAWRIIYLFV